MPSEICRFQNSALHCLRDKILASGCCRCGKGSKEHIQIHSSGAPAITKTTQLWNLWLPHSVADTATLHSSDYRNIFTHCGTLIAGVGPGLPREQDPGYCECADLPHTGQAPSTWKIWSQSSALVSLGSYVIMLGRIHYTLLSQSIPQGDWLAHTEARQGSANCRLRAPLL